MTSETGAPWSAPDARPVADRLYALFHLTFWVGPGAFYPFLFPLLVARGVTAPELGLIAAVNPLCALAAQSAVGWLCDRTGRARWVLGLLALASAGLMPLFVFAHGFRLEMAVSAGFALVNAPLPPLGDALTIAYLGPRAGDYGRFRLWGSLSFAVAGTAAGIALHLHALDLRTDYILAAVCLLPPALLAVRFPVEVQVRGSGRRRPDPRELLRARPFLWFLALATVNMLALNAQGTYFSVYVGRLGGGPVAQGLGWALPALLEAPFFLWAARIERRVGIRRTMLLAFACEVAALTVIALARGPALAVAGMTVQGPAFALFYGAAVPAVDRLVPSGWRASGQSLLWASCYGIGAVVANLGGGLGAAVLGLSGLYRVLALLSFAAAGLFASLAPRTVPDGRRPAGRDAGGAPTV